MPATLVTCYVNPDLDGVAGAIAYAEFLNKTSTTCEAAIIGEMHDEAKYLFERFGFTTPKMIENADAYEAVILVDASDLNGLEGRIAAEKVVEIVDHRKVHEANKFPNAKVQIELVGAAATLIAEKFMEHEVEISREAATLLYGAVISNTLNFKGISTDRDVRAAQWLNQTAQLPDGFWKELFIAKSDLSGEKLTERINGDYAWFVMGDKKLGVAQIEMIGAAALVAQREGDILEALDALQKKLGLDFIFLNTIELEETKNFFVTSDTATKDLLERVLVVQFSGNIATRPHLIMRKQIVPLLKEALEKRQEPSVHPKQGELT